jgi:hypothetical protein
MSTNYVQDEPAPDRSTDYVYEEPEPDTEPIQEPVTLPWDMAGW